METGTRQRSPWVYVLLGCGGLAGLMCLAGTIFVFFVGKQVKNVEAGMTDPQERQKNAVAQLGAIPEGYHVVASMGLFGLAKTTVLTDRSPTEDGGISLDARVFMYRSQMMPQEQYAQIRDFFGGQQTDELALRQAGLTVDEKAIVKRSEVTVDGRKLLLVVTRGPVSPAQTDVQGLNTAMLFVCPDNGFRMATWSQREPDDAKGSLAGTVADEAEIARLLKPINPCGK